MAKPILLAVDDDREVLGAVERDLRRHYSVEYRVLTASSGAEALETLDQLRRRGSQVALFLADQRMPGMTDIAFLGEARKRYPEAVRALVAAEPRRARVPGAESSPLPVDRHRAGCIRARAGRLHRGRLATAARRAVLRWHEPHRPGHRGARAASRAADAGDTTVLRPRDRRRRAGGAGERRLRGVRGIEDAADRATRAGRPGREQLVHRELPGIPGRVDGRGPGAAGGGAGAAVRGRDAGRPAGR